MRVMLGLVRDWGNVGEAIEICDWWKFLYIPSRILLF